MSTSNPSNHIKNIAIVGAGGHLGIFITSALLAQDKHTLTALTRSTSTSPLPPGLHSTIPISYGSHASLVAALRNQDALIITMGIYAPPDSQTRLVDAAIDAGVRYIMPNEYGIDVSNPSLAAESLIGARMLELRSYIETRAREQGQRTKRIGLTCSFWYEFSLAGSEARFGFDFEEKKVTFLDDGETKISASTWPLCGRAVAKLFALPIEAEREGEICLEMFANAAVLVSCFTVSQRDMMASVLRVTGDRESDWTVTHENAKERYARAIEMMQKDGMVGFVMAMYARVFFRDGGGDFSHKTANKALGLDEEDLDEYTKVALKYHADGLVKAMYQR